MAQTSRYIGIENGLSSRRIFSISKDSVGYMWFLTSEGIDRYDGRTVKHYKLTEQSDSTPITSHSGWLFMGERGRPIVAGSRGYVFRYNGDTDRFHMVYKMSNVQADLTFCYQDDKANIWLCNSYNIAIYNYLTKENLLLTNPLNCDITDMVQVDENLYFVATSIGVSYLRLVGNRLQMIGVDSPDAISFSVSALYYHPALRQLFIGAFERGIFIYDLNTKRVTRAKDRLQSVKVSCIVPLDDRELLIGTEGMGVHKLDCHTRETVPYIVANNERPNEMSGNNIYDVFVDEQKRIWLADYPIGVTVMDNRYENYYWIKHSPGNSQSLVNDYVHSVIEDSDGDLWFGTHDGISLYRKKSGIWHSFLASSDKTSKERNHIFLTLCEVSPGIVYAGGYASGIYGINKRTMKIEHYTSLLQGNDTQVVPGKYIRDIIMDSKGYIWMGGLSGLKRYHPGTRHVEEFNGIRSVTAVAEKDSACVWVGTSTELLLLDYTTGRIRPIDTGGAANYINALYQDKKGRLYVATQGAGLMVYDSKTDSLRHYHKGNSALVTNHICSILPERDGYIFMGTENGLTRFSVAEGTFKNWSKEQGLMSSCLDARDAVMTANGSCIFGTSNGVVVFPSGTQLPEYTYFPMMFSEFHIAYQMVYPGEKDSPLAKHINLTERLELEYNQNSVSFRISSVNYDSPGNVYYKWRLDGFYDKWTRVESGELLRLINLSPGDYTLYIEAYSKTEPYLLLEKRLMQIQVNPPWWLSIWAIMGYILIPASLFVGIQRFRTLRRQKREADEKSTFFINTAHNIRTPLTLIKAPLEELSGSRHLTVEDGHMVDTALRNVDALQQLSTNLINFEQADRYSTKMRVSVYELNSYVQNMCDIFGDYARLREIKFTCHCNFSSLNVWFDKEKMDAIMQNLLSNAMKYTPEGGEISLVVNETKKLWTMELKDNGIGMSPQDLKRLFHLYFRGSNAVNSKVTGSGIGLPLVRRLVRMHGGWIKVDSVEKVGTTIYVEFPKNRKHFYNYRVVEPLTTQPEMPRGLLLSAETKTEERVKDPSLPRVLVVEDNDELRFYLQHSLSSSYHVETCGNGKEALALIATFNPELVIADIMMPEMRGDELCAALKNNVETSHIPVMLLTALNDEHYVLDGLRIGADEYMAKPFSVNILRAKIANLLQNRKLLRKRFANPEFFMMKKDGAASLPNTSELDVRFIDSVKKLVEEHLSDENFTVDVLCAKMCMSRTSFYNKLKAMTGQPPLEFVRNIRLIYAARLLVEERLSVNEVADRTGFCDSKYFREVFKKHFGVSPSQYAKGVN